MAAEEGTEGVGRGLRGRRNTSSDDASSTLIAGDASEAATGERWERVEQVEQQCKGMQIEIGSSRQTGETKGDKAEKAKRAEGAGGGGKRRQRTFEFRELCLFDENMIIGKFDKGIFLKCVNDSSSGGRQAAQQS